jgi:hypothetical protein
MENGAKHREKRLRALRASVFTEIPAYS